MLEAAVRGRRPRAQRRADRIGHQAKRIRHGLPDLLHPINERISTCVVSGHGAHLDAGCAGTHRPCPGGIHFERRGVDLPVFKPLLQRPLPLLRAARRVGRRDLERRCAAPPMNPLM